MFPKHFNVTCMGLCTTSEKAMAPHPSTLAWKIPWMEEPGRLQSMGSKRVGHNWPASLSLFTFLHWRRKWQPTPVFLPGESQGRGSLVGCHLWGRTESDMTEATQQQQQHVPYSYFASQLQIYFQSDAYSCRWYVRGEQTASQLKLAGPFWGWSAHRCPVELETVFYSQNFRMAMYSISLLALLPWGKAVSIEIYRRAFWCQGTLFQLSGLQTHSIHSKWKSQTLTGTNCNSVYVAIWNNIL